MQAITFIKRSIQIVAGLILLAMFGFGFLTTWFQHNPPSADRLEAIERSAEGRVNEDDSFLTKVGVLVTAWWESDEVMKDVKEEKAMEASAKAERRKAEESRRFNDPSYDYDSDYYPEG